MTDQQQSIPSNNHEINEPPIDSVDDTQPRAAIAPAPSGKNPDKSWFEPLDTKRVIDPDEPPSGRCLLSLVVALITTCIALTIVSLSVVAGYRDELKEIQTEDAQALGVEAALQYDLAIEAEEAGLIELAQGRYIWIATNVPNYRDVSQRLANMDVMLSVTPTPEATHTPTPTIQPTATATLEETPTATQLPVVEYYSTAEGHYNFRRFEEAIEWLDAVIATDPSYRRAEVDQMLFESLRQQAMVYFRGTNPVEEADSTGYAGNQLSRGVQLANRAIEIHNQRANVGTLDDLEFEMYYANQIILSLGYMDGGQHQLALPILQTLYSQSTVWSYRGLTIEGLLQRAQTGSP